MSEPKFQRGTFVDLSSVRTTVSLKMFCFMCLCSRCLTWVCLMCQRNYKNLQSSRCMTWQIPTLHTFVKTNFAREYSVVRAYAMFPVKTSNSLWVRQKSRLSIILKCCNYAQALKHMRCSGWLRKRDTGLELGSTSTDCLVLLCLQKSQCTNTIERAKLRTRTHEWAHAQFRDMRA